MIVFKCSKFSMSSRSNFEGRGAAKSGWLSTVVFAVALMISVISVVELTKSATVLSLLRRVFLPELFSVGAVDTFLRPQNSEHAESSKISCVKIFCSSAKSSA